MKVCVGEKRDHCQGTAKTSNSVCVHSEAESTDAHGVGCSAVSPYSSCVLSEVESSDAHELVQPLAEGCSAVFPCSSCALEVETQDVHELVQPGVVGLFAVSSCSVCGLSDHSQSNNKYSKTFPVKVRVGEKRDHCQGTAKTSNSVCVTAKTVSSTHEADNVKSSQYENLAVRVSLASQDPTLWLNFLCVSTLSSQYENLGVRISLASQDPTHCSNFIEYPC